MLRYALGITLAAVFVSCSDAQQFTPLLLSDLSYDLGSGERGVGGFSTAYLNASGQAVIEVDSVWDPTNVGSNGLEPDSTTSLSANLSSGSATILVLDDHGPRVVATTAVGLTSDARDPREQSDDQETDNDRRHESDDILGTGPVDFDLCARKNLCRRPATMLL